tara:strand:- start:6438 stop:6935 length:498 start_codon:yes stop_codon:yes gene_type:complete
MNIKNGYYAAKYYVHKAYKYVSSVFERVNGTSVVRALKNSGSRVTLGLIFFVFALHALVGLPYVELALQYQPDPAPRSMQFLIGLQSAGYFFIMLKVVELICGVLLLWGRYLTLALTALAPIIFNIVAYHAALEPNNLVLALIVATLYLHLTWQNRGKLSALLIK